MWKRPPAAWKFSVTCALMAPLLLASTCATTSSPGVDCAALGRPPLTGADIDAVSDETALWLRAASEYCGW